ncbi:AraC family transcriptional regulator [Pedobacter frigoris]|uniref:Helix-turn-helix domain-containing protein n=1 Tax=Pedobacter frigoris TaxID=2571272 RepID=A0A4U1CN90_9SPHI|nr:AraC family transcriptional regulator [Pedobacter frigoris]TKC08954.1 helix-turn-helix domain-containing protein [Pedobacter frigoris]
MNVLQFTIPVPANKNIILQEERGPFFYPHLHRHTEMQLTWIEKGEGTLVVSNQMYPFSSGDIFCIGANQPHVFKSSPGYFKEPFEQDIKALTIFFNPSGDLKGLFGLTELSVIQTLFSKYSTGFGIPESAKKEVVSRLKLLFKSEGAPLLVGFIELMIHITQIKNLKLLSANGDLGLVSENEGVKISQIYHYIMTNYNKEITLEEISKKANMTPPAFCRYFKKRTLRTFISFLNEVRVNEACQQLVKEGSESSKSLIAYNCGFNNVTHFNRVFRAMMGKSPSEYLNNYLSATYIH